MLPQIYLHLFYSYFKETFFQEQYKRLVPFIKDKIVYDIGASFGDSSLYFYYKGAKQVIAYENDEISYNECKENMKNYNNFILNKEAPEPFKPINNEEYVIKCDIEGAEHNVFTKDCDLTNCKAIILEYHGGPKEIPNILKEKGFNNIEIDEPWIIDKNLGPVGFIFAYKN